MLSKYFYQNIIQKSIYLFATNGFLSTNPTVINNYILKSNNYRQLFSIIKNYQHKFNGVNLATFLKKISEINSFDIQLKNKLLKIIVDEIQSKWILFNTPQATNKRAIANIVCYLSNLKHTSLNHKLKQINMSNLFAILNPKEFVMVYVGLIKLGLLQCLNEGPQQTLYKYVNLNFPGGYLISIWKALISQKLANKKINKFIASLLIDKFHQLNLIDFIYFLYCYNQQKQNFNSAFLITLFSKYPKYTSYKPLLTAIQLTIAYQNVNRIQQLVNDKQFMNILFNQHIKIINFNNLSLRNVSNTFNALKNIVQPPQNIINRTYQQLIIIMANQSNQIDNMSLVSLFTQLLQIDPHSKEIINVVSAYLIKKGLSSFSNSQIQQLMYGFYLHKKQKYQYDLDTQLTQKLIQQIIKRQFEVKQIVSIINFSLFFKFRSIEFCHYSFKTFNRINMQNHNQQKIQIFNIAERIKQQCFMSKTNQNCLHCLQKLI